MSFNQGGGLGYNNQGMAFTGQNTSGYITIGNPQQHGQQDYLLALQQLQLQERHAMLTGNKPVVVCGGEIKEADDMDKAQALAETLAHSKSADAYILKPVKKVAPKRDVVTTDLP